MAIWDNIKNTYSAFLTQKDGASGASGAPAGSSGTPSGNTYGTWLQNLIGNIKTGVGNAVNTVATAAKNAANNASQAQAATTTGAQKQTMEYRVGQDEPVAQNLPAQAGQDAQRVNLSAGTNSASGATGTGAATEQKAYAGAWAGSEPIDSYEEFLRNKESAYGSMRDEQTQFYDEQSQKALAAIEAQRQAALAEAQNQKNMADTAATEQKNAALAEAENQKNLLVTMSEEQKNAVYKFAEEQRISDMNYAAQQYQLLLDSINAQRESGMAMATEQRDLLLSMSEEQRQAAYKHAEEQRASATAYANSQYQTLVDAINAQKESGMAMAEEQRQLLLSMSEEQRNAIYAAAESQRVAAEQRADVERERGVVDARSSYEQNKASYGANAEAMGSMGLAGSGYSDYLNSKAYAQQRAETQAANAQADASKREARYTEDQARLKADSDYYQNKYNAEQAYSDRKYQIDTTYQTNMLNAEQNKAQSIYEAENAERDAKYSADSAHAQNEYSAEAQYSQNKYEVDTTYQNNLLGANQSKAQAEHEATSAERESKFSADQAHAQNQYAAESGYSQSKYEAESAERDAKLQSGLSYSENLFNAESQARSDKLTAEQTADAGKFSAEMSYQQNLLENDDAIGKHRLEEAKKAEEKAAAEAEKAEADAAYAKNAYYQFLAEANQGNYTVDQITQLAADYGLSSEQTQSLIDAVNGYTAKTEEATKQQQTQNKNEIGGYITGETTDEEIQDYVDDGYISEEDAEELKKDREKAAINEINSYISSGDFSTMQSKADSAYNNGYISKQQYQKLYYDACIKNCQGASSVSDVLQLEADLTNLKNAGKLTGADYNNAVKYLYSRAGSTLSYKAKYGHNVFGGEVKNGQLMEVTMNGETYDISTDISGTTGNFVDKDTAKVLAGICGNSYSNGSMAKLGDTIYVYRTGLNNGSGWVKVNQYSGWVLMNGTSKGFYEQYTKEIGYQPSTSAPASTATNSAFQQIQSFIDSNNLREGDRARWGQAFKFAGLLDLYNTLTADEKAALKGKS